MRKLRAAAAVAAMVAGLGTVGAGTAFAGGQPMPPVFHQTQSATCAPTATQNNNALVGDLNLLSGLAVGVLGQAESNFSSGESVSQTCEIGQANSID